MKFFKAKQKLLLLDYDGTLAPFHKERNQAYPYPGVTALLTELQKKMRIVIISGRSVNELPPLLKMHPHPELFGSHGRERLLSDGTYIHTPPSKDVLSALEQAKIAIPQLEVKPFSLCLHWREQQPLPTPPLWIALTKKFPLELHSFNGGIELRPTGLHKGDIVRRLLQETPSDTAVAYLGDDQTDEQAFEALGKRGLKVLVQQQKRKTCADLILNPPEDLLSFLTELVSGLTPKSH